MDSESNDTKDPFEGYTEKEIESSEVSQDSNTQEIKSAQDHSDEKEVESHDINHIEEEDIKDTSEDDDDNDSLLDKALEPSIDIKTDDDDDDIAVIEEKAPPPKPTFECRECGSIFKGKYSYILFT